MVRSPHPAKPFHLGPFVSLQFLIFMITLPDITPASGPSAISHHQHPSRETGGGCWEGVGGGGGVPDRTYKQGTSESRGRTAGSQRSAQHGQYLRNKKTLQRRGCAPGEDKEGKRAERRSRVKSSREAQSKRLACSLAALPPSTCYTFSLEVSFRTERGEEKKIMQLTRGSLSEENRTVSRQISCQ